MKDKNEMRVAYKKWAENIFDTLLLWLERHAVLNRLFRFSWHEVGYRLCYCRFKEQTITKQLYSSLCYFRLNLNVHFARINHILHVVYWAAIVFQFQKAKKKKKKKFFFLVFFSRLCAWSSGRTIIGGLTIIRLSWQP